MCRREIPEMAADPVAVQRGTPDQVRGRLLKRLDEAYRAFFRRVKAGEVPGFPRFRGRWRWDSLSVVSGVRLEANPRHRGRARLRVPGVGWLTVRRRGGTRYPEGEPVTAVLKREAGKWYVVVYLKVAVAEPQDDGTAVGVDANAGQMAVSTPGVERLFHAPDTARQERGRSASRAGLRATSAAAGAGSAPGCVWRRRTGALPAGVMTGATGPAGRSPG